jgi:hypothetical protein
MLLLGACAPSRPDPLATEDPDGPPSLASDTLGPPLLRVVYVIHGDADYAFHDSAGRRLQADREALQQALSVARRARRTETFIFHQRPARGGFFSGSPTSGTFYHYRSGSLVGRQGYLVGDRAAYLETEAALLQGGTQSPADASAPRPRTVLVYFGHEIPLRAQEGYFASEPSRVLSAAAFARGLDRLATPNVRADGPGKPFDLLILSMCYGATPALMQALAPSADQAVASPAYLHLSYLDTRALADFTQGFSWDTLPNPRVPATMQSLRHLADTVAAQSFERLKTTTQTEVTVGIYDLEKLRPFLQSDFVKVQVARAEEPAPRGRRKAVDKWMDCANDPAFNAVKAAKGTTLFYRMPRFGPLKDMAARSPWQCAF